MALRRPSTRSHRHKHLPALAVILAAVATAMALAVPAQATPDAASADAQTTAQEQALAQSVANTPTLSASDSADMANLPVIPAGMSCAQLAKTTGAHVIAIAM